MKNTLPKEEGKKEISQEDMFKSLWPLPGGWKKFTGNLIKILKQIHGNNPSLKELAQWSKKEFRVKEWIVHAIRTSVMYSGLAAEKNNSLFLTDYGKRFLDVSDSQIVLKSLLKHIWGVKEVLLWLKDQPLTMRELYMKFVDYGTDWKTKFPIKYRVDWLRALGYIHKAGRKYALTKEGKKIVRELST